MGKIKMNQTELQWLTYLFSQPALDDSSVKINAWSKAHPESSIPHREAGWKQSVEQDVYLWLLGHCAAVSSSSAGAQSCQALRGQNLKHRG